MDFTIQNTLAPDVDYRYLELSRDGDWPQHGGRQRTLLVAFNVPGYYSLPVRILALTASLTEGVKDRNDVRYVELEIGDDWTLLSRALDRWSPAIVGITANIWNIATVLPFLRDLKERHPRITTLLGGQEVTGSISDLMAANPEIDYMIDGEGELPFLQFLRAWDAARRTLAGPRAVSGLRYRDNGSLVSTGPSQLIDDLDRLPSPILAGLVPVGTKNKLGVMLEGARGCPYQCSFCFEGSRHIKVRMASLERLAEEARFMVGQGATYFHLMDPILCNSKPERLKGIADLFKDLNRGRKMQISLETYAQHINDQIAPYLSDFTILDVGLQSINAATQKEIRRSFSRERFCEGLASLRKVNPNFNLYLICGLPHETLLTFLQGIEFVLGEQPVRIFINELCLLNGTELRRRAAEYGYEYDPEPPYKVHASRWMDRREMRLAHALANVVYRRYNFSIRALFPLAPWVKNASLPTGEALSVDLCGPCGAGCPGCLSRDRQDITTPAGWDAKIKEAAGKDVEIIGSESVCSAQAHRLLGQLQLMGASRLKITAPLRTFADPAQVEKLVSLGVLHFKTFTSAEYCLRTGNGLEDLRNITRPFSMKGYASLTPLSEVVVLQSGEDLAAYRNAVERAVQSSAEIVSIPAPVQELGAAWVSGMADCFRQVVNSGKWLKVPMTIAREGLEGVRDRDEVLELLARLDLLSAEPNTLPCMNGQPGPGEYQPQAPMRYNPPSRSTDIP